MKKTNFITKIVNRPTTKGGTRIMIIAAMVELLLIIATQYFPEHLTPEIIAGITSLAMLVVAYGASREEKPQAQRGATENPEPQPGITENPPIKRG